MRGAREAQWSGPAGHGQSDHTPPGRTVGVLGRFLDAVEIQSGGEKTNSTRRPCRTGAATGQRPVARARPSGPPGLDDEALPFPVAQVALSLAGGFELARSSFVGLGAHVSPARGACTESDWSRPASDPFPLSGCAPNMNLNRGGRPPRRRRREAGAPARPGSRRAWPTGSAGESGTPSAG